MGLMVAVISGKDVSGLDNPRMTTKNNPMYEPMEQKSLTKDRNSRKLMEDAQMRRCPWNGHVYRGMMSTRYEGGE